MTKWLFILALLFSHMVLSAESGTQFELTSTACLQAEFNDDHPWWHGGSEPSDDANLVSLSVVPLAPRSEASVTVATTEVITAQQATRPIRAPPLVLLS
ncbi:hypothetical protein GCM10011297_33240 [Bacterioplanes sanyensis]|uniref:hypothetical protein n=1 Tax=Bacterioplanes sanyensis TaxID=1249553 RepID=UPI001674A6BD|nr:hypothetical protein [Bacterioplanes sanyensis]GGY57782.1 hypothetical protein GCM10011297_33240 [Bacterioplanes sanyensis]